MNAVDCVFESRNELVERNLTRQLQLKTTKPLIAFAATRCGAYYGVVANRVTCSQINK